MSTRTKGFTLIELLVVIAIIGILSSVVFTNISSARNKAADAAVKSNLASVRTQAELYYGTAGNYRGGTSGNAYYEGDCLTTNSLFKDTVSAANIQAIAGNTAIAIASAFQNSNNTKQCRLSADGESYMITIGLKTNNTYWCIDNGGDAKNIGATVPASGVVSCP